MSSQVQLSIRRCPACGEFLPAGRIDKRFHNSACRSRYYRAKKLIGEHSVTVQRYIADMLQFESDPVVSADVNAALHEIVMTLWQSELASSMMLLQGGQNDGLPF